MQELLKDCVLKHSKKQKLILLFNLQKPLLCLLWIVTRSWTIIFWDQQQPATIIFNYEFQAQNPEYHYKKRTLVFSCIPCTFKTQYYNYTT